MARIELDVEPRQVLGKKVARLRRAGILPANIYGHRVDSLAVQVDAMSLLRALRQSGVNAIIDLKVTGERAARPAIIRQVQRDPLTSKPVHVDFYQVSLREKMRADVPIVLTGHSEAVSAYGGILLQTLDALHVEALPLDIPARVEVDVSPLVELEAAVHVRDLALPGNVAVLTDADVVVARVAAPRVAAEEEVAAAPAPEAPAAEAAAPPPEEGKTPED